MHGRGGANSVPMAIREICCLIHESHSKQLFFNTKSVISTKSAVGTLLSFPCSNFSCKRLSPASCRMLGQRLTASTELK